MHRFYLSPEACEGPNLQLSERESHHAADVLRVQTGDRVAVLDGAGREFLCAVRQVHRKSVLLETLEVRSSPPPPCLVTLLQAIPKGKLIETIIQKATELGAAAIVPLISNRTIATPEPEEADRKAAKWQGVAVEAIKQCGARWLPTVNPPTTVQQLLRRPNPFELALVASLRSDSQHPRSSFTQFRSAHGRNPRSIAAWVGPEGDFTAEELDQIQSAGAVPVTLGPLVLRAETAATYCLSVIGYELHAP